MTYTDQLLTPTGISEAQAAAAARTVADQAARKGASGDLLDVLASLGLIAVPKLTLSVSRDSTGRIRTQSPVPAPEKPVAAKPAPPSPLPELPPGHAWCKCPGERHILTPGSSETTYVDPRNHRQCRVSQRRKKRDATKRRREQLAAGEAA